MLRFTLLYFRRILNNSAPIPHHFSPLLRSLVGGLLEKDPKKRLGCGPREAAEVKEHPFFKVTIL